ncbi:CDP-diacylglycerol--serine O-phosphatidyltransferase [bacterium]|nr:CDP-diacylglycerol--serine O-phosphatidyltransferase [bacterium]
MAPTSRVIHSGKYLLPNLLTTFNLICGMIAILVAIENYTAGVINQPGEYAITAWLLLAAMVFDYLDGKVARWTNTASDFGVKIDSFTDFVSFGIAPVVIAYTALLQSVSLLIQIIACFSFLLAGAWRLARFNCETISEASSQIFIGLPIPAAATFVATMVLVSSGPKSMVPRFLGQSMHDLSPQMAGTLTAFLLIALAALMISRIPFPAFKRMNRRNLILLGGVGIFFYVLSLVLPWGNIIFLIMLLYIFIGLFQYFLNRVLRLHQKETIGKKVRRIS